MKYENLPDSVVQRVGQLLMQRDELQDEVARLRTVMRLQADALTDLQPDSKEIRRIVEALLCAALGTPPA